ARDEERRRAAAQVEAAQAQLGAARARLAQLLAGPRRGDLAAARAAVDQAETRLAQVREGVPRAEDAETARLAHEAADAAYRAAQTAADDAGGVYGAALRQRDARPPLFTAEQAQLAVAQAQQALHQAEAAVEQRRIARDQAAAALRKVEGGATAWDVRLAEEAVAQARGALDRLTEISAFDVQAAEAQVDQAEAGVAAAEAQLAAAARPTGFDLEAAELAVAQAEAQRDRVVRTSPYDIAAAEAALAQAEAALSLRLHPWGEYEIAAQRQAVAQAEAQVRDLAAMRRDPIAASAQVEAARAALAQAEARLAAARAQLEALETGPTAEQVDVAGAQLAQARAAAVVLETQLARTAITAPAAGVLTKRLARPGEAVVPGAPLATLADLDTFTLTVYVPESEVGRVRVNQAVEVRVDAFPGESFPGTVTLIGTKAEFTPRNVQTPRERSNLVFAVKVRLDSAGGRLKPGMPADAALRLG
ncbi:MAG TPA: efflux RND transporter periplasmic adaptor subunit, partial [Chloroflexota bacterium]|nr:efflux RND transporter periplasmic adaptor subunit [Chloroflexota bacterium]